MELSALSVEAAEAVMEVEVTAVEVTGEEGTAAVTEVARVEAALTRRA